MEKQMSFTDYEYSFRKRKTKREEFLDMMDAITPWDEIVAMIKPFYYHNIRGSPGTRYRDHVSDVPPAGMVQPFG